MNKLTYALIAGALAILLAGCNQSTAATSNSAETAMKPEVCWSDKNKAEALTQVRDSVADHLFAQESAAASRRGKSVSTDDLQLLRQAITVTADPIFLKSLSPDAQTYNCGSFVSVSVKLGDSVISADGFPIEYDVLPSNRGQLAVLRDATMHDVFAKLDYDAR